MTRAAALLLLVMLGAAEAWAQEKRPATGEVGKAAPEFVVTDFRGRKISLSQYRGKVVLLDFWASWCVPCQTEIPRFIEWQKRYGSQGLQVISISMDDDERAARRFASRRKINYPLAMGTAHLAESYGGILGLPANLVIGRDGEIVARHVGVTELAEIEEEIRAELAK